MKTYYYFLLDGEIGWTEDNLRLHAWNDGPERNWAMEGYKLRPLPIEILLKCRLLIPNERRIFWNPLTREIGNNRFTSVGDVAHSG